MYPHSSQRLEGSGRSVSGWACPALPAEALGQPGRGAPSCPPSGHRPRAQGDGRAPAPARRGRRGTAHPGVAGQEARRPGPGTCPEPQFHHRRAAPRLSRRRIKGRGGAARTHTAPAAPSPLRRSRLPPLPPFPPLPLLPGDARAMDAGCLRARSLLLFLGECRCRASRGAAASRCALLRWAGGSSAPSPGPGGDRALSRGAGAFSRCWRISGKT